MAENRTNTEIKYEIIEKIGVIGRNARNDWTREVNVVVWNESKPKIDIREWSPDHGRMSRGITLTEDETMEMTKALVKRYRERQERSANEHARDDMTR